MMNSKHTLLLILCIGLLTVAAQAATPDHEGFSLAQCSECHQGYETSFAGPNSADKAPNHRGFDCTLCHDTQDFVTPNLSFIPQTIVTPNSGPKAVVFTARSGANSFADGDANLDGICEVCHTATAYHRNALPSNQTHNTGATCVDCHTHADGFSVSGVSCLDCHNTPRGSGGYRRQVVENAGDGAGDFVSATHHVTDGSTNQVVTEADCLVCHDQSSHQSFSDGVSVLLKDPAGGASLVYDGSAASVEAWCLACHDGTHSAPFSDGRPALDLTGWTGSSHGSPAASCLDCHGNGHGSSNRRLVNESILTPNSGSRAVVFTNATGPNSFADGDGVYDGVCEVCHTATAFHRNSSAGDHSHNAAADCASCHDHGNSFRADGTDCVSCHNSSQGAGGYRRQIVENAGDGGGDFVLTSHHVTNGTTTEIVTNTDCVSCHDQASHMSFSDGVSVLLVNAGGGASVLYDGSPASLQPFCLGCHDGTHNSPFSDGNPAPDKSGWTGAVHGPAGKSCAECHNNGHGTGNLALVGDQIVTPNSGSLPVLLSAWTGTNSLADGDGTFDGACEVCHTTTNYHRNNASGSHAHNAALDCRSCHAHDAGYQPETSCVLCHNTVQGDGGYRRQIVENAGDGGGDFVLTSHHVTNGTTNEVVTDSDCVACHDQSNHMTYSDGVSVLLSDAGGGASVLYDGTPASLETFCLACHDGTHGNPFSDGTAAPDMSTWDGTVHGPSGKTCAECHNNGHGTGNLKLVGDQIGTPNSGLRSVVLSGWTGTNSLADGDATFDGACEVCHSNTTYHRNDATGDHTHNAALDCRACHGHNNGYQATGGCTVCHSSPQGPGGYRRQIVENAGDGGGDFVRTSHHVNNGTGTEIVTDADCVACHDQANHQTYNDGVSVYLLDPAGGASLTYDGSSASLTPFCAACHDGTVTGTPFSDGMVPPNNLQGWTQSSHGAGGAGCANCHGNGGDNGHGGDNPDMLQAAYAVNDNNAYVQADYALCWSCHDSNAIINGINRFEDLHDKHVVSADAPCVICHNTHGSYDPAEPGMIDFSYGLDNGMDIVLTSGRDRSSAFTISGTTGSCYVDCHGKSHTPKTYDRSQAAPSNCALCHSAPVGAGGNRRQIVELNADGKGDFVKTSHHVTDGTTSEVVTTADCETCHDQANHRTFGDGVSVLLRDLSGGASIVYDGTPASGEAFCLACHDGTQTGPFSDGNAAPDKSGWNGAVHGPAGKTCMECHNNGHGTGNLALVGDQITTPNSGVRSVVLSSWTGANSLADGDGNYNGACEACHTTTTYHRNNATGDHTHNVATDCRSCHGHDGGYQASTDACLSCHNSPQGAGGYRRQIVENAGDGGGEFVLTSHHVTNGTASEIVTAADCQACHDQANHMSYSDGVSVLLVNAGGGASIVYDGTPSSLEPFCLACHDGAHPSPFSDGNAAPDMSAWDGTIHGPAGKTCAECHNNGHGSSNLKLIGTQLATPNSGVRSVVLTGFTGANSFADGDANYNGICEACHTTTNYHRNSAGGDHTHNVALDCRGCHDHNGGYQASGSCLDCHNTTQGSGGYRRQVVENGGDGGGDFVRTSHHVTDGSTTEVVNENDCIVCHDQSSHQSYGDGVSVKLNQAGGGAAVVYDGTPASLTPFCVKCHDGTQSSPPFSDGTVPPNRLATWSTSAHNLQGADCAECHSNGHGGDADNMLTGTYVVADYNAYNVNDYALCWNCHSASTIVTGTNAFEDLHDKHVRGEDTPCIMCHNTHGAYDNGEPGMIDFSYGLDNGYDITLGSGRDRSGAFVIIGTGGFCYVDCHGKNHKPKSYSRGGIAVRDMSAKIDGDRLFSAASTYPSPSRGATTIVLGLTDEARDKSASGLSVRAAIYDLAGRKLRDLSVESAGANPLRIFWDGRDHAGREVQSGLYFCRIVTDSGSRTVKIVVVR